MAHYTLSTLPVTDGALLACYDWALPRHATPRGTVLLVHGLGEHMGRYDALAQDINRWGFAVRGYRGAAISEGRSYAPHLRPGPGAGDPVGLFRARSGGGAIDAAQGG